MRCPAEPGAGARARGVRRTRWQVDRTARHQLCARRAGDPRVRRTVPDAPRVPGHGARCSAASSSPILRCARTASRSPSHTIRSSRESSRSTSTTSCTAPSCTGRWRCCCTPGSRASAPGSKKRSGRDDDLRPVLYLKPTGLGAVCYFTLGHCRGPLDMQDFMPEYPNARTGFVGGGRVPNGAPPLPPLGVRTSPALASPREVQHVAH